MPIKKSRSYLSRNRKSGQTEVMERTVAETNLMNTPLIIAARNGNLKGSSILKTQGILSGFIDHFEDLKKSDDPNNYVIIKNAMLNAASHGHTDIVMYILTHTVNPKSYHAMAIEMAIIHKHEELAMSLLSIPNFNRHMLFRNPGGDTSTILEMATLLELNNVISLLNTCNVIDSTSPRDDNEILNNHFKPAAKTTSHRLTPAEAELARLPNALHQNPTSRFFTMPRQVVGEITRCLMQPRPEENSGTVVFKL